VAPEDDAVAAVVAEAPPEVPEAVEVAPEAIEPEPEAVEVAPEAVKPQPEAIEPEPRPEPAPESIAASAPVEPSAPVRDDVIVQPTWPVSAPEAASQVPQPPAAPPAPPAPPAPASAAPWLTVAPETGAGPEPQWSQVPIQGRFGANAGAAPAPAGSIVPHGDPAALWAASAREVLSGGPRPVQPAITSTPTPQPCISCGLPLSASARFCRRCGSRQG